MNSYFMSKHDYDVIFKNLYELKETIAVTEKYEKYIFYEVAYKQLNWLTEAKLQIKFNLKK